MSQCLLFLLLMPLEEAPGQEQKVEGQSGLLEVLPACIADAPHDPQLILLHSCGRIDPRWSGCIPAGIHRQIDSEIATCGLPYRRPWTNLKREDMILFDLS